jgi:hypothetical protein
MQPRERRFFGSPAGAQEGHAGRADNGRAIRHSEINAADALVAI